MTDSPNKDIDGFFTTDRVAGRDEAVKLTTDSYQNFLYALDDPKLADCRGMDYEEFARDRYQAPFLQELLAFWESLYLEPFTGITSDGTVRAGLYELSGGDGSERSVSDPAQLEAAEDLLAALTGEERASLCYPIDAPEWRAWSNPEFVVHRVGLRLEDLDPAKSDAFLTLIRACLSPEGFVRVREAMELNGYLGELVDLPTIMNERSYWAAMFGTPSAVDPWGWQLFGHHVAVNFVSVAGRQVIAPVFIGGEPALSDGAHPPLFESREQIALDLASSFTEAQRAQAVVYTSVLDPSMPEGRLHPADERHVAGAFRDNRVIPYEGIRVRAFTDRQRALLRLLVEDSLLLLVEPQRRQTLEEVEAHIDETFFSWYGATDGTEPFYFRIHSPVIIAELDHHAGVWLSNRLPARFHVHTTLRLPNGNDYGRAYIAQLRERRAPRATEPARAPDAAPGG